MVGVSAQRCACTAAASGPADPGGPRMTLTLSSRRSGGATVVKLAGDLDAASAVELRMYVLDLVAKRHPVVVLDLADVPFIDSAGCRALVDAPSPLAGGECE